MTPATEELHNIIYTAIFIICLLFALAFHLLLEHVQLKQTIATLSAQCPKAEQSKIEGSYYYAAECSYKKQELDWIWHCARSGRY